MLPYCESGSAKLITSFGPRITEGATVLVLGWDHPTVAVLVWDHPTGMYRNFLSLHEIVSFRVDKQGEKRERVCSHNEKRIPMWFPCLSVDGIYRIQW